MKLWITLDPDGEWNVWTKEPEFMKDGTEAEGCWCGDGVVNNEALVALLAKGLRFTGGPRSKAEFELKRVPRKKGGK